MERIGYKLEQINDCCGNYKEICNLFFELVQEDEMRIKLEDILYNGKYKDFYVISGVCSKDNPYIEATRRISIAYLMIRNPETFDVLVSEQVNLFHGTNANALPSILKYGLNSGLEAENQGLNVTTGEKWSRIGGKQRDFVSFTDVLDIAGDYSTLHSSVENADLSFGVIIGTTVADARKAGRYIIGSDVPEVGVRNRLPLEGIKVIGVPSDKVKFVEKLLSSDNIKVVAIDGMRDRFYYCDDFFNNIDIDYDNFNKLKDNLRKPSKGKFFDLGEARMLMVEWIVSKAMKLKRSKSNVVGGETSNYDGRLR